MDKNVNTETNIEVDEQLVQAMIITKLLDEESGADTGRAKAKVSKTKVKTDKAKVKTDKAKVKVDKTKTDKDKKSTKMDVVPELTIFKKLRRDMEVTVDFYNHDIKYKNQSWGIPEREVAYKIELVRGRKESKDICDKFVAELSDESKQLERSRAVAGKVRYFKVVSYADNIPYRARVVGYIRVYPSKDGTMKTRLMILEKVCRENNIGSLRLKEKINKEIKCIEAC